MAPRLRPLVLLLALLAGQWLSIAHGFQHSVLQSEGDCVLWVQVRDVGSGAPSTAGAVPASGAVDEAPNLLPQRVPRATTTVVYRSRAPPQFLV